MTLEQELRIIINQMETTSQSLKDMRVRLADMESRLEQTKTR